MHLYKTLVSYFITAVCFKGCHYFYTSINAAFIVRNWQSAGTGFEAGIDEPITT